MKKTIFSSLILVIFSWLFFNMNSYQLTQPKNDYGHIYLSNGYGVVTKKVGVPLGVAVTFRVRPSGEKYNPYQNAPTVNQYNPTTGAPTCGVALFGKCF